jgi:hypothetical protein
MNAEGVLPHRTARNVKLRHGYTLDEVRGLSMWTVLRPAARLFPGSGQNPSSSSPVKTLTEQNFHAFHLTEPAR